MRCSLLLSKTATALGLTILATRAMASPQGFYSPKVCPKFNRDGGKSLFVFTAGDWNNPEVYHLTIVPIKLRD